MKPWLLACALCPCLSAAPSYVPAASHQAMLSLLDSVKRPGFIEVSEAGRSAGGRSIPLVRLHRSHQPRFKVLLYAQQHGDEVAGKEALLSVVKDIARHPETLPQDVDLYLLPMMNPDGAVAYARRNGANADLNRDHLTQAQPEIQALYATVRRLQPHLAADCHEFTRDGEDYPREGRDPKRRLWARWPLITLDGCNHPLIPQRLKDVALRMVESARPVMAKAGIAYDRYLVGGPAPDEEVRPSTVEVDDGRNGLGSHGVLSFIIESGVRRSAPDPQADLPQRVTAYRTLLKHLLGTEASRNRLRTLVEEARREPLPPFIATNVFWGNVGGKVRTVKRVDLLSGEVQSVATPNAMFDIVVKQSVPTPSAYAIEPRAAAQLKPLLEHHGLRFRELVQPETRMAEPCTLLRVEEPYDELYQRYEHRQIVRREKAMPLELPKGTLMVELNQPWARRAMQFLEPCLLYGLYSYPEYRALADASGRLPVLRVLQREP
ncbi:MAG: succinylglutamate desuccinylase/aspartoacylase family protein [Firmicutes bacterium]|nr:succinylglutamate desuccinylase/aspartoacylase family protein [Bacillota bacterium]